MRFDEASGVEIVGASIAAPARQSAFKPLNASALPLLPARQCTPCHAIDAVTDPIARCLPATDAPPGTLPVVCFGEHGTGASGASRDALRAAAAEHVVASAVTVPERQRALPLLWVLAAAGLGLAVFKWRGGRTAGRWQVNRGASMATALARTPLRAPERVRLPQIDASTCLGCNACVEACPYDVLEVQRYVAVTQAERTNATAHFNNTHPGANLELV